MQLERPRESGNEILSMESELELVLIDLEQKKLDVESLELLIEQKCEELEVKEKEYNAVQISIKEKEAEFDHLQKSVSDAAKKLDLLEKSIEQKSEEVVCKSKELDSIQGVLKMFDDVMDLKERRLSVMQKSYEDCGKEFELKKEHLKQCQCSIDVCEKEIKLKERRLNSIQNSVMECSKELELKEKRLKLVRKLEEQNLESLKNSMKQYAREFEIRKRKSERLFEVLELKEELLKSKFGELDLMYKKVNDCLIEAESRDRNFALLQGLVEKRLGELVIKESEFERRVSKFKLVQGFELIQNSSELGLKEVEIEQFEPSYSCMTKEKKGLYEISSPVSVNGQTLPALQPAICTVDKAPDVAECIQKLIQRGEIIHAIRHICELKLTDKFSPVPLLIEYLEDAENYTTLFCMENRSIEAKEKVMDKEVAALRTVMECITACNLTSEFPSNKISQRIHVLEDKGRPFTLEFEQLKKRRISSLLPLDKPSQQGNVKFPLTTKPPGGCVKMSFCCAGRVDCGFLSVVARNASGTVLAIWCRKTSLSNPLAGEALAARGALTLASSSGWEDITLEGNSEEVISYLQQSREPTLTISGIMAELVGLLGCFKNVVPICVTREVNIIAHKVSEWAARHKVKEGPSWMSVPSCLFYSFS